MADTQTQANPATALHEDGTPERLQIDTIRTLSMDAVSTAKSGHIGTPMALAPVGHTLWTKFLRTDPSTPDWPNRDRFVLSVGHASMLLYALLHLAGVEEIDADGKKTGAAAVSLDDIKAFRQLGSKTPGHPEYRHTTGVETTTGPLGAGCGNSVGMAIAERWLAARYNRDGFKLFEEDSRKEGTFHIVGGQLAALEPLPLLIIAEGYATAAIVAEAALQPVVAAFDAGNLLPVVQALHSRFPDKPILIAGDDDRGVELKEGHNPGCDKATAAAAAVGGLAIFPEFAPGEVDRDPK
eukprot:gene31616-36199_t